MKKIVLTALFLMGALAMSIPITTRAVGQENHPQQVRNPDQNADEDRNRNQEQQHQSWNGDYTYEETADRNWLEEQQQKHNNQRRSQHRSKGADHTYEETVDRNWLNEHNLD